MKKGSLSILIDSGSTHNFLEESIAKKLKCPLIGTPPLSVTVANENRVLSNSACLGLMWEIVTSCICKSQNLNFSCEFMGY